MPKWWHTSSWRKQYPKEKTVRCTDIQTLKNTCAIGTRRNDLYALCPPYAAPKKSGRPKEATRIKGSIEMSLDKKKGKKGEKIPIEPEDDDIGKKKRGHLRVQQRKKKTKTSSMSTPTKKKWKCGYKKSKSPKNKKSPKRQIEANEVMIRRLEMILCLTLLQQCHCPTY